MCEICKQLHSEGTPFLVSSPTITVEFSEGWKYRHLNELIEHLQETVFQGA